MFTSGLRIRTGGAWGSLADFKRIHLKAGESAAAAFILSAKAFMVVNEEGEFVFDGSAAVVTCGGSQPDSRSVKDRKDSFKIGLKVGGLEMVEQYQSHIGGGGGRTEKTSARVSLRICLNSAT